MLTVLSSALWLALSGVGPEVCPVAHGGSAAVAGDNSTVSVPRHGSTPPTIRRRSPGARAGTARFKQQSGSLPVRLQPAPPLPLAGRGSAGPDGRLSTRARVVGSRGPPATTRA